MPTIDDIEPTGVPSKGEPGWDVWVAALDVATDAPLKQGTYVSSAQIPWKHIHELRNALQAAGIDWRSLWDKRRT